MLPYDRGVVPVRISVRRLGGRHSGSISKRRESLGWPVCHDGQAMPPSPAALERNIRLFYALRLFRYLQVWIPVWVVYLTVEQGFSLTQVTTADAAFFIGITVLEVPTGAVADRWGRSTSLALGAAALAVALLFFGFTTSYPVLLASFLVWALAEALSSGADLALLFDTLKALGREHEYEKHAGRGEAALAGGALLGTLLGGPVAAITSTQSTIFIGVGTTALTALLALAMVEAPYQSEGGAGNAYFSSLRQAVGIVIRRPAVRGMMLVGGVLGASFGTQEYLVQPYLLGNDVAVGLFFSLLQVPIQLGFVVGALVAATLTIRVGEPRLLPGITAAGGLALVFAWGSPGLMGIAFIPIAAAAEGIIRPISTGYINRRVPSDQRATILSMQSLTMAFFITPLAPLVGATADANGVRSSYLLIGGVALVGGAIATGFWLRSHRREDTSPQLEPHFVD